MPAVDVSHTVAGSGPPVYFVHGIGSRKEMWASVVETLSAKFTCVAFDLRGHGASPTPPVPYNLDDLVDDLEALRRTLGHETIHIVGHSLGGQVGPAYAHRYPTRTASVSLLSTAAGRTDEDRARVIAVVQRMRDEGINHVLPTLVDRWYTEPFAAENPAIIEHRIDQVLTTPPEVFLSVFDVYAETEMLAWLPEVTAPCLVLTGEHDPGCSPRLNSKIHGALPNSELIVLPNLRHSIIVESPAVVTDAVRAFLEQQGDESPRSADWIDTTLHPITDLSFRTQCAEHLNGEGALVLEGFFTPAFVTEVRAESNGREADAFFASSTHNIWLTDPDDELGSAHIFNRQIVSTKGLLADDQVSAKSPLRAVYDNEAFRSFIAAVVGVDAVHPYADDLSSINIHFHRDGEELGWHFDNSSFAVTTLIQPPESGGAFEYVKDLRDAEAGDQNFDGVVTAVDTRAGVAELSFAPSDLVLFRGRNSMHRVTPSLGDQTRILVVFAFNTEPDIGLSESAKKTFYGRV